MPRDEGTRIDHYVMHPGVGVPVDIGWGWAVLNADQTVTRTCKGCKVSVTTGLTVSASGSSARVATAEVHHRPDCPIVFGNDPVTS